MWHNPPLNNTLYDGFCFNLSPTFICYFKSREVIVKAVSLILASILWQRTSKEAGSSVRLGSCTTNVTTISHVYKRPTRGGARKRRRRRLRPPALPWPTTAAPLHPGRAHHRDWTASAPRPWIGCRVQLVLVTVFSISVYRWCRRTCWRLSICWVFLETAIRACQHSYTPVKVRTWRRP